jgi:hypothetical protein
MPTSIVGLESGFTAEKLGFFGLRCVSAPGIDEAMVKKGVQVGNYSPVC